VRGNRKLKLELKGDTKKVFRRKSVSIVLIFLVIIAVVGGVSIPRIVKARAASKNDVVEQRTSVASFVFFNSATLMSPWPLALNRF
jgi:hypothetical protein